MNRFFTLLFAASCLTAVGQVPDYVPTDGLVGWWAFDGNAQDGSGNGIDLTEVGSVEYGSDRFGNAISAIGFVGGATESRVQFPNFSLIDGWNQGTLSFWVNVLEHNVTGNYFGFDNMFSVRQRHGVNTQFMLGFLGGTTRVRIHLDGGLPNSGDLVSEQALVVGQWHLVTMTFNGSEGFQNIYIDGQPSGSLSSSAMLSSMESPDMFAFGFYGGVGSGSCNSIMDEVGLWNRALDAIEVESLFATIAHVEGCIDTSACNFDSEATVDNGSCIPSGCLDANACNFNSLAQCEGEACDYSCCPGPGCCDVGTEWSWVSNTCIVANPADINLDGCVQLNDLLDLLSAYGDCGAEEEASGFALSFDGVNDHVDFGNASIGNVEDVTFEVLMKTGSDSEGLGSNYQALLSKDCDGCESSTGDWAILIGHNGNGVASFTINNSSGVAAVESGALNDEEWHWISVTRNATTGLVHLYVDGVEVDSDIGPVGLVHNEEKMYLAKYFLTSPSHYEGLIGEFRVWNRELTGIEIGTYLGAELQGNESGLVGLWNFSEGEGDVLTDQTNGGLNGQIIEATWTSTTETP